MPLLGKAPQAQQVGCATFVHTQPAQLQLRPGAHLWLSDSHQPVETRLQWLNQTQQHVVCERGCDKSATAGILVSTSLGAFGPLFGSDYVYNATSLELQLDALGVVTTSQQLLTGRQSTFSTLTLASNMQCTAQMARFAPISQHMPRTSSDWHCTIRRPCADLTWCKMLAPADYLCCCAEIPTEFYYRNASTASATIVLADDSVSKQRLQWVMSWLDFSSISLYLVATLFIILYQQHVLVEVASRTVTVVDYSVQVWDLPKVCSITDTQLVTLTVHAIE